MQAILTRILPATDTRPTRIKATCARGSITISYPHEFSGEFAHQAAVDALVQRFTKEDAARYHPAPAGNPWLRARACGRLPNGDYAHVFVA